MGLWIHPRIELLFNSLTPWDFYNFLSIIFHQNHIFLSLPNPRTQWNRDHLISSLYLSILCCCSHATFCIMKFRDMNWWENCALVMWSCGNKSVYSWWEQGIYSCNSASYCSASCRPALLPSVAPPCAAPTVDLCRCCVVFTRPFFRVSFLLPLFWISFTFLSTCLRLLFAMACISDSKSSQAF